MLKELVLLVSLLVLFADGRQLLQRLRYKVNDAVEMSDEVVPGGMQWRQVSHDDVLNGKSCMPCSKKCQAIHFICAIKPRMMRRTPGPLR